MLASSSFHHSNLQLAYTTQACIGEMKLVPCKQTYVMHIRNATYKFMSLLPLLVCFKILIELIPFLLVIFAYLWELLLPLSLTIFVNLLLPLCHQ
jgi:hypothetical protein